MGMALRGRHSEIEAEVEEGKRERKSGRGTSISHYITNSRD